MAEEKYRIYVKDENRTIECSNGEVILEALKRAGIPHLTKGCFGGGCGVCKIRILEGQYDVVKNMSQAHIKPAEQNEGFVLGCCITAKSDLTIIKAKTN